MLRTETQQALPALCPSWVRQAPGLSGDSNAAFAAGAALASLDGKVRLAAAPAGAWRQRLSLVAAAATCRRMSRREDEDGLRDAWLLRRTADDWGPGGRVLRAWRSLAGRSTTLSREQLEAAYEDFGVGQEGIDPAVLSALDEAIAGPATPVAAAAEILTRTTRLQPRADLFALWLADLVLAHKLRWPFPLPLIARGLAQVPQRQGRVPKPGEPGFQEHVALAYAKAAVAALDLAGELDRRAAKLTAAAPKLRAKEAGLVVRALLEDDAIAPSGRFGAMSDRAMRRLCDRLVELGAVRELTGRSTFRLYGL